MNEQQVLSILGALSQETRLRIVKYLIGRGEKGASAGDVGTHVGAASSRASFHLSALENAGVITSERQSRKVMYRANFKHIGQMIGFLLHDCCADHPQIRSCCDLDKECS